MSALPSSNLKRYVPTLRLHKASGQWVSDIDGSTRYFGRETEAAWAAFLPLLAAWREQSGRQDGVTVHEAAHRLSAIVARDCGHPTPARVYANLKFFCAKFGPRPIDSITADDLEAFKSECQSRFKPKTVNHFLGATKRMLRYAAFKTWRTPIEMSFIKMVSLPTPPPKHVAIAEAGTWMDKADAKNPNLGVMLRVMLATGARPSEMLKLAQKAGTWLEPGVFALTVGKTDKASKHPRCLVVPSGLMPLVEQLKPQWAYQANFSTACTKAFGSGPHRLRHTSAYLVHRLPGEKTTREDTDIWLGHYPGFVSLVYNPVDWSPVKALAARYLGYLQATLPHSFPLV